MLALSAAGYGAIALPSAALITATVGFLVYTRDTRARKVQASVAEVDLTVKAQAGFITAIQAQLGRSIDVATAADNRAAAAEDRAAACEQQTAGFRSEIADLRSELRELKWRVKKMTPKEGTT